MSEPVRVPDWPRFWLGTTGGPEALAEALLRLVVLYGVLTLSIRLMGRRTSFELTRNELLAIVALAAAIGPAILSPERGLLPPVLIATWVVAWQRLVARATFRSARLERAMHGEGTVLVEDGVVQRQTLKRNGLARERLFAELRTKGLLHLGEVDRVYLEADGSFSTVTRHEPRPGLALTPGFDADLRAELPDDWQHLACAECGKLRDRHAVVARCLVCDSDAWVPPVSAGATS